jgi:hypothetical protein
MELLGQKTNKVFILDLLLMVCVFFCLMGVLFVFSDFRHFENILINCKEKGYIQNKSTRILCMVDDYNLERSL